MNEKKWQHSFALALSKRFLQPAALLACIGCPLFAQQSPSGMPMQPESQDGAAYRQLQKKVFSSRLLDGMEDLSHWSFQGAGSMTLSTAEVKQGQHSIRIAPTDNIGRVEGSGDWQDLVATRKLPFRRLERLQPDLRVGLSGCAGCPSGLHQSHVAQ